MATALERAAKHTGLEVRDLLRVGAGFVVDRIDRDGGLVLPAPEAPAPPVPVGDSAEDDHERFRHFRHKGTPTPRDIRELLPADVIAKFGDIWELTGCNVAYHALWTILDDVDDEKNMPKKVAEFLEAGWIYQLDDLVKRWNAAAKKQEASS